MSELTTSQVCNWRQSIRSSYLQKQNSKEYYIFPSKHKHRYQTARRLARQPGPAGPVGSKSTSIGSDHSDCLAWEGELDTSITER